MKWPWSREPEPDIVVEKITEGLFDKQIAEADGNTHYSTDKGLTYEPIERPGKFGRNFEFSVDAELIRRIKKGNVHQMSHRSPQDVCESKLTYKREEWAIEMGNRRGQHAYKCGVCDWWHCSTRTRLPDAKESH